MFLDILPINQNAPATPKTTAKVVNTCSNPIADKRNDAKTNETATDKIPAAANMRDFPVSSIDSAMPISFNR